MFTCIKMLRQKLDNADEIRRPQTAQNILDEAELYDTEIADLMRRNQG